MQQEIDGQIQHKNFRVIPRDTLPKGTKVLPGVWILKRKRKIATGEIYKWKARLNLDGSRQQKGVHFDQTYAPVASWAVVRLILILVLSWGWKARQLDYVMAFTQAPTERPMFMEIPKGYTISKGDPKDYVLEILANTYGARQAPRVWYQYLKSKLMKAKWKQSKWFPIIFYKTGVLYVLYVDDSIIIGATDKVLDDEIKLLQRQQLQLTVEGNLEDFLGVNITKINDSTFHLHQAHQINNLIKDLHLKENTKTKDVPCKIAEVLKRDSEGEDHDATFHYRSVIGKLSHVKRCTRLDLAYIVHQCARFNATPKLIHTKAIKWIGRYLMGTKDKGYVINPNLSKGLQLYVDSDWAGNWSSIEAHDRDTARSRFGFIIMFAGVPIFWASRLQTLIALSSTEAEYIGLSEALREVIPLIELIKELQEAGFNIPRSTTKVLCKVFEDNVGAIKMAK